MSEQTTDIKMDRNDEDKWCELIDGVPFPLATTPEQLDRVRNLKLKPDDIVITAYPKCGNNWLKYIVMLMVYEGDETKIGAYPYSCPNLLMVDPGHFESLDVRRRCNLCAHPRYFPHGLGEGVGRHIAMLRNPKDVLVSKHPFDLELVPNHGYEVRGRRVEYAPTFDQYVDDFIEGNVRWGSFFEFVTGLCEFMQKHPGTLLLCYEEMREAPFEHVKLIAEFLGYDYSDELLGEIVVKSVYDHMKKHCYGGAEKPIAGLSREHFFRSGRVGDWRTILTPEQSAKIDTAIVEKLGHLPGGFNYKECLDVPCQYSSEA